MIALRAGSFLALCATLLVLCIRAYVASVNASSLDDRLAWGLPLIAGSLILGHGLAAWAARRRQEHWQARTSHHDRREGAAGPSGQGESPPSARRRGDTPLSTDGGVQRSPDGPDVPAADRGETSGPALDLAGHGLCLVVAALCTLALAHVPVDNTVTAMRQQVPPVLGLVYPLLAGLTPLILRRRRSQQTEPFLWLAVAALPLSGALLLLDGPTALCLAALALLEQLARGPGRLSLKPLLVAALAVVGLLSLATLFGLNSFHAVPSLTWTLAVALIMLALACRPRDAADVRRLLCAPLAAAVAIAGCGLVLKIFLALNIDVVPAFNTRLTLFRQHPNFLAPFFAFQTVMALGLALSSAKRRRLLLGSALLLAVATWDTDSRSGKALLVVGVSGMVALPLLRRAVARHGRLVFSSAATLLLLGVLAVLWAATTEQGQKLSASSIDRFEKSLDYRLDAWRNAIAVVRSRPWLGAGPHTFVSEYRFQPGSRFFNEPTSPHPHNVVLYVAQSAGIAAMVLFLVWVLLLCKALWHRPARPDETTLPPRLGDALLAAVVALLLANQLDVGLALDTVVPEPLFLFTGLVLAMGSRTARAPIRLGYGLLWLAAIAVVLVPLGLNGVAARGHLERARLAALQSSPAQGGHSSMTTAIASAERALALDPNLEHAYELLARWYESSADGFPAAHELLLAMSARAPHYGAASALLGHLYLRAMMFPEAAEALTRSLDDAHGSIHQNRDRADTIFALCRSGRRAEAQEQLIQALSLDVGVIDALQWTRDGGTGNRWITMGGQAPQAAINLLESVEILLSRRIQAHEAGEPIGRKNWLDTYMAFRRAGADERALWLLDYFEAQVPVVEPHTVLHERGRLFMDLDDPGRALRCFEEALASTGNSGYQADILRAQQRLGLVSEQPHEVSRRDTDLAQLVDILDQPWVFDRLLEVLSEIDVEAHNPGAAAELLQRTLLFRDDLIERAHRWEAVGDLYLAAEQFDDALDAYEEALVHLGAKPFPLTSLATTLDSSQPARLARSMARAWRGQGQSPDGVVTAAWSLEQFFSHRTSWSLFRAALFSEAGQMDALLREAELQLLADPDNLLARWSKVEAFEGLGRHGEAALAMRALSEYVFESNPVSLDRMYEQAVSHGLDRMDDPHAWREVAIIELLRGRYSESAGLFARARDEVPEDQGRLAADLAGMEARATLLTGADDALEIVRALLTEAVAQAPSNLSLRRRLETLP